VRAYAVTEQAQRLQPRTTLHLRLSGPSTDAVVHAAQTMATAAAAQSGDLLLAAGGAAVAALTTAD
jgi:hypothetical protein